MIGSDAGSGIGRRGGKALRVVHGVRDQNKSIAIGVVEFNYSSLKEREEQGWNGMGELGQ